MTRISDTGPAELRRAADVIGAGGIVACATDTVFGLHVDPFHEGAVTRLRVLKGDTRPRPFVILCDGSSVQLDQLAPDRSRAAVELAARHWPGALTLVVAAGPEVPRWVSGEGAGSGGRTIAIRVPGPSTVFRLLRQWGGPLVSTSANRVGEPVLVHAREIAAHFGDGVGAVLEEPDAVPAPSIPSTLVEVTSERVRVLRQGSVHVSGPIERGSDR